MKSGLVIILLISVLCEGKLLFESFEEIIKFRISPEDFYLRISNPDTVLNTLELIKKAGYPAEAHVVETEDGYLLTMHRIPGPVGSTSVFLQHGLLGSSADWVVSGRGKSLAFILADLGYDVWLGNFRGNTYSRSHKTIPSTDSRFWNFSFHEVGTEDLPAMISHVEKCKNDSVIYIGHSMGTTAFYVMAIERAEMNPKVRVMFSLAPVAFMNHLKSPIKIVAPYVDNFELIAHFLGQDEFLPQNGLLKFLAKFGCEMDTLEKKICTNALFVICGFDENQFNKTLLPVILSHTPAGTSTKAVVHFGQEINSGKFRRYDYGWKNMEIYNMTEPPDYDISKIKIPIVLFYADNDWLASPKDVDRLYRKLPTVLGKFRVDYSKFNHLDYLWGIDVPKLVYEKLISVMAKFKN